MIPAALVPAVLDAVARRDRPVLLATATDMGVSVPRLVQEAVRLAHDPRVYAANPRPCRVILERQEASRQAWSVPLPVRSEV